MKTKLALPVIALLTASTAAYAATATGGVGVGAPGGSAVGATAGVAANGSSTLTTGGGAPADGSNTAANTNSTLTTRGGAQVQTDTATTPSNNIPNGVVRPLPNTAAVPGMEPFTNTTNAVPGQEPFNSNRGATVQNGLLPGTAATTANHLQTANGTTIAMPSNMNQQQFDAFAFSRWDANNNGTLSRAEWRAINPSWFGTPLSSFNTVDANRNGIVDRAEVSSMFTNNNQMFSFYDTNHDGIIDSTEATRIPQ